MDQVLTWLLLLTSLLTALSESGGRNERLPLGASSATAKGTGNPLPLT